MKPETKFKIKFAKRLKEIPKLWFSKIQQVCIIGTPDFLICFQGIFIAVELKATEADKLRPMQEYTIGEINEAEGLCFVIHPGNVDAFIEALNDWEAYKRGLRNE